MPFKNMYVVIGCVASASRKSYEPVPEIIVLFSAVFFVLFGPDLFFLSFITYVCSSRMVVYVCVHIH